MNTFDFDAQVFAGVFLALGGMALGVAGIRGAPKLGLGLAVIYLLGAVGAMIGRCSVGYWLPPLLLGGSYVGLTLARRFRPQVLAFVTARYAPAAFVLAAGPLLAIGWAVYSFRHFDKSAENPAELLNIPYPLPSNYVGTTDRGRPIP